MEIVKSHRRKEKPEELAPVMEEEDKELHEAVQQGNLEEVKKLIRRGTRINSRNEQSQTPLHLAFEGQYSEIAGLLLEKWVLLKLIRGGNF